eukprot:scaffold385_cov53-Phaeocystis_antarctica.AAC.3
MLLPAARGAHAPWARRARAANARAARRTPLLHALACGGAAGLGRGAAARTSEVQRGEGRVGFERGSQLLGPLVADPIPCGTRGARAVGAVSACGERSGGAPHAPLRMRVRAAVPRGWGGGAAARTVEVQLGEGCVGLERGGQPLGPLVADLTACGTRGAHAVGAASACGVRSGRRAARPPARVCACGGAAGVGRGAAARTSEVQRGEGRVGFERGSQLLGPLVADPIPCGTRGARAVGACAAVPRCWGGGAAARTVEAQRGEGRVGLERGGQPLGPLVADLTACGTRGRTRRGRGERVRRALGASRRTPFRMRVRACGGAAGLGGVPLHAPLRSSVVSVVLALSAAASALAPSSPILLSAARGARAPVVGAGACGKRSGRRAARPSARVRVQRCRGGGRGAAARTVEVQRGAALADLLQPLSERPSPNHASRPLELARLTATLRSCSCTLPAQRNREGDAQASTP